MDLKQFEIQMERLKACFSERSYPDERVKYIWRIVESLSANWFEKLCDKFIASCRFAPLPEEFLEEVRNEKKKTNSLGFSSTPHPSENSIFSKEEIKEMFQVMKDVTAKKISPSDARQYAAAIQRAIDERNRKCDLGVA